jgi:hypothetical protein
MSYVNLGEPSLTRSLMSEVRNGGGIRLVSSCDDLMATWPLNLEANPASLGASMAVYLFDRFY